MTEVTTRIDAYERSSIEGRRIAVNTPVDRPAAVPLGEGEDVFLREV